MEQQVEARNTQLKSMTAVRLLLNASDLTFRPGFRPFFGLNSRQKSPGR